ncbi:MAG: dienelactone hydrolase [Ramlibacter sp.]|nr:dienelactone hydrolase [Ramlibacter sp.]
MLATSLALASATSQAAMGLTELPGAPGDGPVTVYYPADAVAQPVRRGPFTLTLAVDAPPIRGNGRLVVISHGSGGSPWVHADLARALVEDGFTVALPEHQADNYKDFSTPGPESWKRRPAEVSRAIDTLGRTPRFAALLQLDKVGLFGGSAGGHTALTLAGGRWSPALFRQHCEAHITEDFSSCVGFVTRLRGNWLDGLKTSVALGVIRQRFDDATWQAYTDPRIQAAVASVPFAADFDMASLARPRIPLGLVIARKDINQIPRFHVEAVRAACVPCETVADLPEAGHGAMLSPLPTFEPGSVAQDLLSDPPGFDRSMLPQVDRQITAFMRRHLLP